MIGMSSRGDAESAERESETWVREISAARDYALLHTPRLCVSV
jgi:hypothetical protein